MKQLNFTIYIPPKENLAMKADLSLPWRKLMLKVNAMLMCEL